MRPVCDVTKEQSMENFRNNSFLSKREILYAIDHWLDKVKNNKLDISISDIGRSHLGKALQKLRVEVLDTDIPSLEVYGIRYCLDVFGDAVQLGYEVFDERELFDEYGDLVAWEYDEDEKARSEAGEEVEPSEDEGGREVQYFSMVRIPIKQISLERWAEINGVNIATARQWAARNRIETRKEGRDLKISVIHYTPYQFAMARNSSCRFTGVADIPEKYRKKYDFLFEHTFDVLVPPCDEGDKMRLFVIGKDGDSKSEVRTVEFPFAKKAKLIDDLLKAGLKQNGGRHMVSPVGEAIFDEEYRFDEIRMPHEKDGFFDNLTARIELENEGALSLNNRKKSHQVGGDGSAITITVCREKEDGEEETVVSFYGCLMHRKYSAELQLLKTIFGEVDVDSEVTEAIRDAGIMENRNYPWDEYVLYFDNISSISKDITDEQLALILRAVPFFAKARGCLKFSSVVWKARENLTKAFDLAGYGDLSEERFHAYLQEGSVLSIRDKDGSSAKAGNR